MIFTPSHGSGVTLDLNALAYLAEDTMMEYDRETKPVSIEAGQLAALVEGCENYVILRGMVANLAILARGGNQHLAKCVLDLAAAEVAKNWNNAVTREGASATDLPDSACDGSGGVVV